MPAVYDELRRRAAAVMRRERADHTLQPTALVHEAYIRLVGGSELKWDNRGHFFGAAARAMRRILVERARHHGRIKHGGEMKRVELGESALNQPLTNEPEPTNLLALDEVLEKLEQYDKRKADVVMLRYFAGLSIEETAAALGVSPATVKNEWTFARAWLHREVERLAADAGGR